MTKKTPDLSSASWIPPGDKTELWQEHKYKQRERAGNISEHSCSSLGCISSVARFEFWLGNKSRERSRGFTLVIHTFIGHFIRYDI